MPSRRRNRRIKESGYSLITWVALLTLIVAAIAFIQGTLKRTVQNKITQVADYMFWTKWNQPTQQYKGETNSFAKTETTQNIYTKQSEKNGIIQNNATTVVPTTEKTISTNVEEGSEPVLKTLDIK